MEKFFAALMTLSASLPVCTARAGDANLQVQVSGYVPLICNVQSSVRAVDAVSQTQIDLGNITEFCNNGSGYEVWADYTPGVEAAQLLVDGVAMPLSPSGSTLISGANSPGRRLHHMAIDLRNNHGQLTAIAMRIVPH